MYCAKLKLWWPQFGHWTIKCSTSIYFVWKDLSYRKYKNGPINPGPWRTLGCVVRRAGCWMSRVFQSHSTNQTVHKRKMNGFKWGLIISKFPKFSITNQSTKIFFEIFHYGGLLFEWRNFFEKLFILFVFRFKSMYEISEQKGFPINLLLIKLKFKSPFRSFCSMIIVNRLLRSLDKTIVSQNVLNTE